MSLRQTFISRLEVDLEGLKLERRLAEMIRDTTASGDDAASRDAKVALLRSKERIFRERLDRARNAPDSDWETVKAELQDAWETLKQALSEGGE